MSEPRIAVDAFGADRCPSVEVEGAIAAARDGIPITLVGDEAQLEPLLRQHGGSGLPLDVHHTLGVITMHDAPSRAVRGKTDASMPVAFELVKQQKAHAVVSAGNSGAMLACGLFKYGRIKGVDRPAIGTTLPSLDGLVCMLDMGANTECRLVNLLQFAVMGSTYAKVQLGVAKPRVAILSNGSEAHKGTDLTRAAHQALMDAPSDLFEYVGYTEGSSMLEGGVDVVVTDGFTGNIALKTAEGAASLIRALLRRAIMQRTMSKVGALLMRPAFHELKCKIDPENYGGAPLLGVNGVAVVCHGGSTPTAIANGIRTALRCVHARFAPVMAQEIARHAPLFETTRVERAEVVHP